MTSAPTIQPQFLPSRNELGVIAVDFSGGQVQEFPLPFHHIGTTKLTQEPSPTNSANPA